MIKTQTCRCCITIKGLVVNFRSGQGGNTTPYQQHDSGDGNKFLGVEVINTLSWSLHTGALAKRAQYLLHRSRNLFTPQKKTKHMSDFYSPSMRRLR